MTFANAPGALPKRGSQSEDGRLSTGNSCFLGKSGLDVLQVVMEDNNIEPLILGEGI